MTEHQRGCPTEMYAVLRRDMHRLLLTISSSQYSKRNVSRCLYRHTNFIVIPSKIRSNCITSLPFSRSDGTARINARCAITSWKRWRHYYSILELGSKHPTWIVDFQSLDPCKYALLLNLKNIYTSFCSRGTLLRYWSHKITMSSVTYCPA